MSPEFWVWVTGIATSEESFEFAAAMVKEAFWKKVIL
jgi:hypothetical protein